MSKLQCAVKLWWFIHPGHNLVSNSCLWFIGGTIYEIHLQLFTLETEAALLSNNWTFKRLSCWIWLIQISLFKAKDGWCSWKFCCKSALCVLQTGETRPTRFAHSFMYGIVCYGLNLYNKKYQSDWRYVNLRFCEERLHKWMLCVEWVSFVFDELHNLLKNIRF